jgi:hypothetical protein
MLHNYAHHAQSPKSSVHSVHKMQGKAIRQTLKKLSYRSSFVELWLQSHIYEGQVDRSFFIGRRSMQSIWSVWPQWSASISYGYVHGGRLSAGFSGLISDVSGRFVHEIVHDHAHVQTDQVNFWPFACAHMHKTDLPIAQINWTSPQIPVHTAEKNQSHVHNSAAY